MSVVSLPDAALADAGIPLQGILDIDQVNVALPEEAKSYSQLLVFAHGGQRLWHQVTRKNDALRNGRAPRHPIDRFSTASVLAFLESINCHDFWLMYPREGLHLDLRGLGRQLGWHHDSPMGIGIHEEYGTWFAYRAVVAVNTRFITSSSAGIVRESPCESCVDKPCVSACPVGAVKADGDFDLEACSEERLREGSGCADRCLARIACPVGEKHMYHPEQISYHYSRSLVSLKEFKG